MHQNYQQRNLKAQKEADKSTFKFYQHIIQLRKTDIFKFGDFRSSAVNSTVFGFVRTYQDSNAVVVVINLSTNITLNARNLLQTNEIPENARGRILAATSTSNYNIDDIVDIDQFVLRDYDAIAFVVEGVATTGETTGSPDTTTPNGAATAVASLFLMIFSVLVFLF